MTAPRFVCVNLLRLCVNAHLLLILALALELDDAVDQRIESVVTALADVVAVVELGASLSDKDAACGDKLTVRPLDAETLRLGVSAVTGGAAAFLVREKLYIDEHLILPPIR